MNPDLFIITSGACMLFWAILLAIGLIARTGCRHIHKRYKRD